jgi:hypothetical protein
VIELQKQLEIELAELDLVRELQLALEPQLVELLRKEQERGLNPLGFEPALGLLRGLRPLELMLLPGLEVRQLQLVIELKKQLELMLAELAEAS